MPRKRANGEGTITKRADGRWELRIMINDERKSFYAKTQAELLAKKKELRVIIDNDIDMKMSKMPLSEWLRTWLRDYCKGVKPLTIIRYEADIRNHIEPTLGKVKLKDLNAPMIQKLYNKKLEDGMSPKTVRNLHGVLHKSLEQATKLGYVVRNECNIVTLPYAPRQEMHPLTDTAMVDFLEAIKGNPYESVYRFAMFTGMRQGEILGLSWDCVNFLTGRIRIKQQLQKIRVYQEHCYYKLAPLKNGKERTITPARQVMQLLRKVKTEQEQAAKEAGDYWNNEWNLVFTNETGGHLTGMTVLKHLKEVVAELGFPEVRFHDLRHTFATVSLENGDNVKTVSDMLGHATTAFTMDVYGHVSDQMQRESAKRMENFICNLNC